MYVLNVIYMIKKNSFVACLSLSIWCCVVTMQYVVFESINVANASCWGDCKRHCKTDGKKTRDRTNARDFCYFYFCQ